MKHILYFWSRNKQIDNNTISDSDIQKKLIEEAAELIEAWYTMCREHSIKNLISFFEELWDVLQVIILMINRTSRYYTKSDLKSSFDYSYRQHNDKIVERDWEITDKPTITVEVKFHEL